MSDPIISVSGLRGIVGETLTPEVAVRYAAAFALLSPPGSFVITQDGRPSGRMLAHAVQASLQAAGRSTFDIGVAATPTTGILVREVKAAGGIQISASHNPLQYNGLKLFSPQGRVIPARPGQMVLDQYRSGQTAWAGYDRLGCGEQGPDTITAHLAAVLATIDVERVRKRRFRVLLDSNHGAGSILGRRLLTELGCLVTLLGGNPDGQFEHTPEPTAENLAGVCASVREAGVEIGFCQDPDADRLAVIDEAGRYLGEEYTLAMCLDHILRRRKGPVVTNCSTSRMSEDLAQRYGVPFFRSAVGEANVVDCMLAHKAVFGGEGNGGPIDPSVGLVRDSFVGMAQLLDAMAARELPISRLAGELPRYSIVKTKMRVGQDRVAAALAVLEKHFAGAKADRLDGLRLDWPEGWLLVRPSNTEPIVRAIAEADTEECASGWCREAAEVIGGLGGAP
ncbi:MAG: phosphoglucosamine mutase [Thermoguttaceae bacterium]